jgi:hypothetical protein
MAASALEYCSVNVNDGALQKGQAVVGTGASMASAAALQTTAPRKNRFVWLMVNAPR